MTRTHVHLRIPVVLSFALLLLATPLLSRPMAAEDAGKACQALSSPLTEASGRRDLRNYDEEMTLTNGTVIGYHDYWTLGADATPEVFRATVDDKAFMAGDYPEGTTLGAVWSDLCPVLAGMGTIVDQGIEQGNIYALMTLTTNDGTPLYGIIHILYGHQSSVPLFTILTGQADGFYIESGIFINGLPAFEDLDHDALIARLQADGSAGSPATTTQDAGSSENPQTVPEDGTTATATEFTSVNGTVFTYSSDWAPDTSMGEGPDGLMLVSGDTMLAVMDLAQDPGPQAIFEQNLGDFPNIIDQGATPDGGYYALAWGQTNGGQWMHTIFRTMYAPGTSTPVVVLLITPEGTLDQTLAQMQGITANGVPVLDGMDAAATIATFDADGPTGAPVFTGGQASQPIPTEAPATSGTGSGTDPGSTSPRDILGDLPDDLPATRAEPTPEEEEEESSNLSEIFR